MAHELTFESPGFGKRIKGMLGVDFYRLFHTHMFYIFLAIAALIPALILGTSDSAEAVEPVFRNTWSIIAANSPIYAVSDMGEYANMNMVFIFGGIMVSGISNVVICLIGGVLFSGGLGAASSLILNKTSLV